MQRSGVTRKLDEVGRIVIPKEIRRYLNLIEGSSLEIGINEIGEVVLRSNLEKINIKYIAELIGEDVANIINKSILFVENGTIIYTYGICATGTVSDEILDIFSCKQQYCSNAKNLPNLRKISNDCKIVHKNIVTTPIIRDNCCIGGVIACSDGEVKNWELQILSLVAKLCVADKL